ncbi:phosphonate ABC transporter, permease protein PhnE [Pseudolactococcus piscium]|uniref:phosphonate ABC transporter, permease protein PhnE n=1 Tax=Pseudolactococcus piscium TaxID=1364 RepID=UPI00064C4FE4|nr:phosphonate ABC transporter, permease protein PhnE [Lactococcus piscium]
MQRFKSILILLLLFQFSMTITGADFQKVFANSNQIFVFLSRLLHPDFAYFPKLVAPLVKTLQMSFLGTFLGILMGIPISFLATTVVTGNVVISGIFRFVLSLVRTIPTLLLAALLVAILGIGEATGVLTIAIFTFGMVTQLMFQCIETIDFGPIEAHLAAGATRTQIAVWAIAPQVFSQFVGYACYAFEVNVRASTVLGYVGAGGIGVILNSSLALMSYGRVSIIILTILITVVLVDKLSEKVRGVL